MSTSGIYGLSGSGIDVDSMVKVGMLTKQNQYDKMYKKQVKNEWLKEAYADVYSQLNTFTNSTMSKYKMSYTTNAMSATSGNSAVATAVANSDAVAMSHTVSVTQTASNAYMLTDGTITRANTDTTSPSDTTSGKTASIKLKDVLFSSTEQADLKSKLEAGTLNASDTAISFTIADGTGAEHTSATVSFTYEDILNSDETLNDLVSKVNAAGVNVTASYDSTNDALSLYQKEGGKDNKITLTVANDASSSVDDYSRTLLNNLNLAAVTTTSKDGTATSSLSSKLTLSETSDTIEAAGTNAEAVIDGRSYSSSSNKISAANVTYTLTSIGTTTMSVSQDTDKIVENVKQFVEDYNKMLDTLNDKYNEKQYSDYGVLTKSQEDAMTETQITKWNEKAKSGLLYHNQTLAKIRSAMREALYTPVESVNSSYNSMMAIGIESTTDQGHVTLDEDKLKKALAADPDCVYQLFASSGDVTQTNADGTTSTTTDYDKEGVVQRLYDKLNDNLDTIKDYAGTSSSTSDSSTLGTLIQNLQTQMSDFKVKMDAYEELLYNKYDAMETAIAKLSAQFNYVSGS